MCDDYTPRHVSEYIRLYIVTELLCTELDDVQSKHAPLCELRMFSTHANVSAA